jgi:UDP-N-acetylmuramoyl-tripeptide--D-alanyl-D-alanine ligase
MLRLLEIASLLAVGCNEDVALTGICIDSRQVKPGHLFIAIRGERLDGHRFIPDAVAKGAASIVCEQLTQDISIPQLLVKNTLQALTAIATDHRNRIDCPVIALTGSNGKTTVKEMIASILPAPAFATPGNLNNHIGVPLSLLQLQPEHRYAVFELGANHGGEIAHTVAMVKPRVTLINNIASAHIEGFGSIDGVARAKGEIYQGLAADGTAIVNDDDAYAHFWDTMLSNKKILRFSTSHPADVFAREITFNVKGCARFVLVTPQGEMSIALQVPGAHNVSNALAATACTYALGIELTDIAAGLERFTGVTGRMTFLKGKNNAWVIDDTYNANLRSVLTALDVLSARPGTRIFVFGDMGELGAWSEQHHRDVGLAARDKGIDCLMTCGIHSELTTKAFGKNARHYPDQQSLAHDLLKELNAQTTVLVKGSRSSAMENIVRELNSAGLDDE